MQMTLQYELHSGGPPFQANDPTASAKKILKGKVEFSSKFSSQMKQVIRAFLNTDPTRRLGCTRDGTDRIMRHGFYNGFDWQGLLDKTIDPPYKPKIPKNIETIGKRDKGNHTAHKCKWTPDLK